ncbi:MAG: transglycosylase SLT domain-containing protein, partial [Bdellovibrionales bacterium]|nr:transglycosylase SLT domain-containing protein [Bdellovibrionales bacterium]
MKANYDPLFVTAVIQSESGFNRSARSPLGAMGLMQVMPLTAKYISSRRGIDWKGQWEL